MLEGFLKYQPTETKETLREVHNNYLQTLKAQPELAATLKPLSVDQIR